MAKERPEGGVLKIVHKSLKSRVELENENKQ